ncbi:MAG: DUF1844 domain-containing protein [Nitrospirae bacterium]|nr:DUF1844 domain-containing protein [Nitrospirota bacterium]MBI3352583.1 DUF1844 domain-containing protein [Nitrospirota bacterium]
MSEENQGFTVSDKRIKLDEPVAEPPKEKAPSQPQENKNTSQPKTEGVALNFSGFLLSLGTSALVHLGENALPDQGKAELNLPHAKEIIDLLSLLEEKTKGNLTKEENSLLSNLLYTLRMKFIELKNR